MNTIVGEYHCKLDSKGRFLMPSGLKKELPEDERTEFVINRGYEKYLFLHPIKTWEEQMVKIKSRNQFVKKNRDFVRIFTNGATRISLDGSERVLIPKRLMEFAGLKKELVLVGQLDKVEIWDKETYEAWMDSNEYDLEDLAEEVMGDLADE
ncbi:MAG: division/cell wall cluster transcriptional repressor MraZ [Bacteroidota bacterium]